MKRHVKVGGRPAKIPGYQIYVERIDCDKVKLRVIRTGDIDISPERADTERVGSSGTGQETR